MSATQDYVDVLVWLTPNATAAGGVVAGGVTGHVSLRVSCAGRATKHISFVPKNPAGKGFPFAEPARMNSFHDDVRMEMGRPPTCVIRLFCLNVPNILTAADRAAELVDRGEVLYLGLGPGWPDVTEPGAEANCASYCLSLLRHGGLGGDTGFHDGQISKLKKLFIGPCDKRFYLATCCHESDPEPDYHSNLVKGWILSPKTVQLIVATLACKYVNDKDATLILMNDGMVEYSRACGYAGSFAAPSRPSFTSKVAGTVGGAFGFVILKPLGWILRRVFK